ncbi:MAG: type II toxin-antitoxin system RelE/ParE family toxin [Oscillospiraceae bacterium]|jgi:phage-related protein|nr:type II toxin-antitoxin system RelE/ParE family toxin [Oscillospiraceae bacterium]
MWNVILYEKEDGTKPVKEFLDALPSKHRAKVVWEIELLEEAGLSLGMPYVRHIKDKLWELRIKFASDISRVFYFVPSGNTIVLLHGFVKKSQKTPKNEISIAETYLSDFERREGK